MDEAVDSLKRPVGFDEKTKANNNTLNLCRWSDCGVDVFLNSFAPCIRIEIFSKKINQELKRNGNEGNVSSSCRSVDTYAPVVFGVEVLFTTSVKIVPYHCFVIVIRLGVSFNLFFFFPSTFCFYFNGQMIQKHVPVDRRRLSRSKSANRTENNSTILHTHDLYSLLLLFFCFLMEGTLTCGARRGTSTGVNIQLFGQWHDPDPNNSHCVSFNKHFIFFKHTHTHTQRVYVVDVHTIFSLYIS